MYQEQGLLIRLLLWAVRGRASCEELPTPHPASDFPFNSQMCLVASRWLVFFLTCPYKWQKSGQTKSKTMQFPNMFMWCMLGHYLNMKQYFKWIYRVNCGKGYELFQTGRWILTGIYRNKRTLHLVLKSKWPFKQESSDVMLLVCMRAHSSLQRDGFVFLSCWVPFAQRSTLHRVFVLLCSAN